MDSQLMRFRVELVGDREVTISGDALKKLIDHKLVVISSDKGLPEIYEAIANAETSREVKE